MIYRTRSGLVAYHDPEFGQTVKWDIPLLGGYKCLFLSDKTTLAGFEPSVVRTLLRERFDVLIVHGYNFATNLIAIATAKFSGTRVIIRGDTRLEKRHYSAPVVLRFLKRLLFRWVDGFLGIGTLSREYYLAFGGREGKFYLSPYCVDTDLFEFDTEVRLKKRNQFRFNIKLPEDSVVVLYVSKLIPRKRPMDVIDAFSIINDRFPNAWLVIVGSGELGESLKIRAKSLGIERVRFIGFQNQSVMPVVYAASDILVLTSDSESWGLVVNEAMASGLPVIISDQVGSGPDLVQNQDTGIIYACGNVINLASSIQRMIQSETLRLRMGKKARKLIQNWNVNECVSGIVAALHDVTRKNNMKSHNN